MVRGPSVNPTLLLLAFFARDSTLAQSPIRPDAVKGEFRELHPLFSGLSGFSR
jgi:hypothetical protein